MILRRVGLALAALVLACSSGCAMFKPEADDAAAEQPVPAAQPAVVVEIEAPGDLKRLLERYLDLSRLGGFERGRALSDTELSRLIDAAPMQVRELLQTEGYFAPEVAIVRTPPVAADAPEQVRLTLQPGPRTVVQRVDLEVEGALARAIESGDAEAQQTLDALRRAWPMKPGTPFRNPAWSDAKNSTLARLRAAGYATAIWSGTAVDIDATEHRARIYAVADSGPLFRSGDIEVEGLEMQDKSTVIHLAALRRGTPVTDAVLAEFQERMIKAGLFETVTITLDLDPEKADAARVLVRVTELSRHQLTVGVGFSDSTGERVTLDHVYRRVFGYSATVRNKFEIARKEQTWDGELSSHPGENFYRNLIGGAIENVESDDDTVLSQRLRIGRTRESQRIDRLYFVEAERSSRKTDFSRSDSVAYSANYHFVWRDIDNPLLPTQGFTMSLQGGAGTARDSSGASGPFGRAYGRFTAYHPLGLGWYGQARLEVGQVFVQNDLAIPDALRFRAGGDDSVRGYDYRSLGPVESGAVGSGNALLTTSIEVARPILTSMPSLWGAVFVDAGNAVNSFSDFKAVAGSGVGLRWRSPVGPLRLDWAYAHELKTSRLHVGVGIVF
ncbi:MAG TPA: BamA/TamA family outer membrane protein [Rubrivivax sp.]